jgi:hypothetical protein
MKTIHLILGLTLILTACGKQLNPVTPKFSAATWESNFFGDITSNAVIREVWEFNSEGTQVTITRRNPSNAVIDATTYTCAQDGDVIVLNGTQRVEFQKQLDDRNIIVTNYQGRNYDGSIHFGRTSL